MSAMRDVLRVIAVSSSLCFISRHHIPKSRSYYYQEIWEEIHYCKGDVNLQKWPNVSRSNLVSFLIGHLYLRRMWLRVDLRMVMLKRHVSSRDLSYMLKICKLFQVQ